MNIIAESIDELVKFVQGETAYNFLATSKVYKAIIEDDFEGYSYEELHDNLKSYINMQDKTQHETFYKFDLLLKNPVIESTWLTRIVEDAKLEALSLLPENVKYTDPEIGLALLLKKHQFGLSLDNMIVLDYPSIIGKPAFLQKLLAHELHHFYSRQACHYLDEKFENNANLNLDMFFIQMATEGLANLISMPYFMKAGEEIDSYSKSIVESYYTIETNDFWNLVSGEVVIGSLEEKLMKFRKEYYKFHAVSFYIVNTIYKSVGKEELLELVKYPLLMLPVFARLTYNKLDQKQISDKILSYLIKENEYLSVK